jgi:hypothetical protein
MEFVFVAPLLRARGVHLYGLSFEEREHGRGITGGGNSDAWHLFGPPPAHFENDISEREVLDRSTS